MQWFWVTLWYVICGLLIAAFIAFYNMTNRPRFRGANDDVTTEVGYNEDSVGRLVDTANRDECDSPEIPHVQAPAGSTQTSTM